MGVGILRPRRFQQKSHFSIGLHGGGRIAYMAGLKACATTDSTCPITQLPDYSITRLLDYPICYVTGASVVAGRCASIS